MFWYYGKENPSFKCGEGLFCFVGSFSSGSLSFFYWWEVEFVLNTREYPTVYVASSSVKGSVIWNVGYVGEREGPAAVDSCGVCGLGRDSSGG